MSRNKYAGLIGMLNQASNRIAILEAEGRVALYEDDNQQAYNGFMKQKAALLAGLAEAAEPTLKDLEPDRAEAVRTVLERFSTNAGQALDLGSVFYMSALLYPADYQAGQLNNLDQLIAELTSLAKNETSGQA